MTFTLHIFTLQRTSVQRVLTVLKIVLIFQGHMEMLLCGNLSELLLCVCIYIYLRSTVAHTTNPEQSTPAPERWVSHPLSENKAKWDWLLDNIIMIISEYQSLLCTVSLS